VRKSLLAAATLAVFITLAGPIQAADFDGDNRDDVAVYRPSNGQWTIRGFTRMYFGTSADTPFAGDFDGDGIADPAYHRESNGFWKAKGVTQFYFGNPGAGDELVSGGSGGQRLYDYVVKPGDGYDLEAALESDTYDSVFIPAGEYGLPLTIDVNHVTRITGESAEKTIINFASQYQLRLNINSEGCQLENIKFINGGAESSDLGTVHIDAKYVSVRNCRSLDSRYAGFSYTSNADYVSFIDCIADNAAHSGFVGSGNLNPREESARFTNCAARQCTYNGFVYCNNLSSCYVWGADETDYGFHVCDNLAACHVLDCTEGEYEGCSKRDHDSCD